MLQPKLKLSMSFSFVKAENWWQTPGNSHISTPPQDITSTLPEFQVSCEEIGKLLNGLDLTKSAGFDRLPTKLLKVASAEVLSCFFDLSKAFDRVGHEGLLAKLRHYGVEDKAMDWLKAYLSSRRQRVRINDQFSCWQSIPAGVPQGSVLGPFLFLVYTVDLPHSCTNANTTCSQFADDTALISSITSFDLAESSLQSSTTAAAKWLLDWHLLVNARKTVIMVFHHDNQPPPHVPIIHLNGQQLSLVKEHRHLGVVIQHDQTWTSHINHVIGKASKTLQNVIRLRSRLSQSALSHLYQTYVRPIIGYASIVTSSLSHTLADHLERFQRRAAKACTRISLFAHIDHTLLLHTVDWPTLFCRRKIKHVLFAHSILYNYTAPHILDMSLPALAFSTYSLRRTRVYELPAARTGRQLTSPINASLA